MEMLIPLIWSLHTAYTFQIIIACPVILYKVTFKSPGKTVGMKG